MAAEAEGQHEVVGRGLAEGVRDFFFWPYRGAGTGWVTDIVEVSLEAAICTPWMRDRRAKQNRRRGWLREEFWYTEIENMVDPITLPFTGSPWLLPYQHGHKQTSSKAQKLNQQHARAKRRPLKKDTRFCNALPRSE